MICNHVRQISHPLIQHKISMLRDKTTTVKEFRELVYEVALLLGYEATRDLTLIEKTIATPLCQTTGYFVDKQVALVPILRAGLGMVDAMMSLIPAAKIGHIGLYRNHETLEPVEYYCKLPPDIAERQVLLLDPMLATGGSSAAAITLVKQRGAQRIKLVCIIAAPEGIAVIEKAHPDVEIICGAIDEGLNENGYIIPGLGDAGDRLYGTI
ncbi:MAG: uracil phosphoribosyltransferase [Negativicutes bacterium]|nr:uracil phosphoribosyltransferase [Negativicutes bacterium]